MASAPANGNGYARFGTVATTIAACLGAVGTIAVAIWFAISIAMAPLQKQLDSQADAIKEIRGELVPRAEHTRDWNAQDQHFSDVQRQIDENKRDIHDMYSAHDALSDLSERLRALENHDPQHK